MTRTQTEGAAFQAVSSTADPAFATDMDGRIVAWNSAAERLFGYRQVEILGKTCYGVLRGRDVFGNPYCSANCPLREMAVLHQAVSHFELTYEDAAGESVTTGISLVVVPGDSPDEMALVHLLGPVAEGIETDRQEPPPRLTRRQLEVLRQLADGKGTEEIASGLCISAVTVRNHVQKILRRLNVHSRLEAVAVARRHRLL